MEPDQRESKQSQIADLCLSDVGHRKTQTFLAQGAFVSSEQILEMKNDLTNKTELQFQAE